MEFRKILVTGADGFIGSHLVERLVSLGYVVKAFSQYNSFNSFGWIDYIDDSIRNEIEVFTGDIRDPNGVRHAMFDCDAVLHLAALIAIPFSYHSPDSYVDVNVKGTLNVLQAAKMLGVKKVIHTSTSEVYGTAEFVPITELHPVKGQSPYSASKIAADQLAYSFYASFDQPVIIVRPFNTFGPRQSARAVIPTIITQLLNGQTSLELGDLRPTRDFSFVNDTVSGFIAALCHDGSYGEVINIGSGFEISIERLALLIADIADVNIEFVLDQKRERPQTSEVKRLLADNSKAKILLNWQPDYKNLDGLRQGLEKTMDWFAEPKNLNFYKAGLYNI
ncbi:NAD-dependent 4,6-dehydratase LegB [Alphaproteobacteria bacterium]|nr:NAD-dependent 4,6-dehydratase LegB [Alphaproteobacteria bacterium]